MTLRVVEPLRLHSESEFGKVEGLPYMLRYMVVSLNYCSQNGGNLYRAPYYNGNQNIGPRIIGNLDQYPHAERRVFSSGARRNLRNIFQKCLSFLRVF